MKVIQEVNTISKDSLIKKAHLFNEDYLVIGGRSNGLIQFYDINQNTFPFELNIMNKNFTSQTEREAVNRKKLIHLHVISNKETAYAYMLTIEEIASEVKQSSSRKSLVTYMKFWKISKDAVDLITQGENPHLNESISFVEGRSNQHNGSFIFLTGSQTHFKLWKLEKSETQLNEEKFTCCFCGQYKNFTLSSCLISNKDIVYSLNENYFIKWNLNAKTSCIEAIHSFGDDKDNYALKRINKGTICLYNQHKLKAFSTEKWEELWSEQFTRMKVVNVFNNLVHNEVVAVIQSDSKDTFYAMRYEDFEGKRLGSQCHRLSKKEVDYIDMYKADYLLVSSKRDIFLSTAAQRNEDGLKEKRLTKQEMDDNDIEMTIKPRKESTNK